jgi:EmrB/QacA subfamily drug resistance transporter
MTAVGTLRVAQGDGAERTFELVSDVVLGRESGADVVLTDPSGQVSRRHARIVIRGTEAVLEDLVSTNGTFVNGQRLDGPYVLRAGDKIKLGGCTLEFVPATAPAPTLSGSNGEGTLTIISGTGAGESTTLHRSATIGRDEGSDLRVRDPEVSRSHAKVTVQDGNAWIDDLHSLNGTYVNGERVVENQSLVGGDRIQIGPAMIELTLPVDERPTAIRQRPGEVPTVEGRVPPGAPPTVISRRPALPPQPSRLSEVLSQPVALLTAESGTRKWWTLAAVVVCSFMLLLDVTIVAVALPDIADSLNPSFAELVWVVDAYTLTLTVVLLTAGSLGDIFGHKRLLMIGLVIFTAASLACAQAPTATFLDLARGVQGIGAAVMFATALALIVQEFPPQERGIAFGAFGAASGLAVALGPIVGGLLTDGFGWEAVFYINVPIGILSFILIQTKLVNIAGRPTRVDFPGVVTFSAAMFLAIYATIRGNDEGWTSGLILGSYGASIVLFTAFLAIQKRSKHPMLDLSLFRKRTFVGANSAAFTMAFASITLLFYLTVWFQSILGYSPIEAGLRLVVFTGAGLSVAPIAGAIAEKRSPRITLTFGLVLIGVGSLSMAFLLESDSPWTAIIPGMLLGGWGTGIINPIMAAASLGVVPPSQGGIASGTNNTFREAGQTAGIAVLGTLLFHTVGTKMESSLAGTPLSAQAPELGDAVAGGLTQRAAATLPPELRMQFIDAAQVSYVAGLQQIFIVSGVVALLGAISTVVLVRAEDLNFPTAGAGQLTSDEGDTAVTSAAVSGQEWHA